MTGSIFRNLKEFQEAPGPPLTMGWPADADEVMMNGKRLVQDGPLPVRNTVITQLTGVLTPFTHLYGNCLAVFSLDIHSWGI